jgi:GntR family transcriptional regulator, transcriptional repressor for pyruvate dehydrogenase complex
VTQERLHTIRRRRLHEDIVQQFHGLIRQGKLKHGDRLPSERDLAQRFNVSRSSVREAIRSLELQGLVVSRRGSGTFINTENLDSVVALVAAALNTDGDNLTDIFEMRHLLEPPLAALAAQRATPEEIARMRLILEEQKRQISAGETGVESDTAFHFALASATHNAAVIKVVSAVEDILQRSRDRSLQEPGRPQRSLASHCQILDMVENRDVAGAQHAMEHHLEVVEPATIAAESALTVGHAPSQRNNGTSRHGPV